MAATLMTYFGGQVGIQAGSAYTVAQSAAMGGSATGLVATIGSMTVGGALAVVVVPTVLVAGAMYGIPMVI
jgi:hypothetical protein